MHQVWHHALHTGNARANIAGEETMTDKARIFDLDGTLVDSLPGISVALNAALAGAGFPRHPESAVRGFVGDGLETTVRRACPAGTGDAVIDGLVEEFRAVYADVWQTGTRPYEGIRELLLELRAGGMPLAVLSNKSHAFTREMVAEVFAEVEFACVLGLRPGMPPKPDPAGAVEILQTLALPPSQCWMIGDSTMDIATGKNAGMRSCAVTWGYHDAEPLKAARPDALVADVDGLRRLLQAGS